MSSRLASIEKVRVQAFVSGIEKFVKGKLLLRLDDGKCLTNCIVSHSLLCQMLDLDPVATSKRQLKKLSANDNSKAKIVELLATLRGIFELSLDSSSSTDSQHVPVLESFHTMSADDIEELKAFYKRLERKRKANYADAR